MGVKDLFDVYLKQEGAGSNTRCYHSDEDIEHCDIGHQDYYTDQIN